TAKTGRVCSHKGGPHGVRARRDRAQGSQLQGPAAEIPAGTGSPLRRNLFKSPRNSGEPDQPLSVIWAEQRPPLLYFEERAPPHPPAGLSLLGDGSCCSTGGFHPGDFDDLSRGGIGRPFTRPFAILKISRPHLCAV